MNNNKINYEKAVNLINFYAHTVHADINDLNINSKEKIRGIIGPAEFEFNSQDSLIIIRGLVFKYWGKKRNEIRQDILDALPDEYEKEKENFGGAYFEFDETGAEINTEYPFRLNLRLDIKNADIKDKEFKLIVDQLTNSSYLYGNNRFGTFLIELNERFNIRPK